MSATRAPGRRLARRCPTLVVGGAGFIGSHTVEALLAQGCQVRVLDDFSSGKLQNLPLNGSSLEVVSGDTRDASAVREAMQGMRWCVHLAAQVSVARSLEDPLASAQRNILGFINVLEAARQRGLERLVYASSAAVYGDAAQLPLREDLPALAPVNPYGLEKLVNERYARLYAQLYRLPTLGLRYFNVYGPRQDPDSPYSGVISRFVERFGRGEAPLVYGDGHQTRDFIHVRDIAQANLAALASSYCGVCNVATGRRVDLLQLIGILREHTGAQVEPQFEPARTGDIRHSCGDARRLRQQLHFAPHRSLRLGLAELLPGFARRRARGRRKPALRDHRRLRNSARRPP